MESGEAVIELHPAQCVECISSELLALYRAFLTVVVEKMDMVDDSYGVIGALTGDIFTRYIEFDRSFLGMPLADFPPGSD